MHSSANGSQYFSWNINQFHKFSRLTKVLKIRISGFPLTYRALHNKNRGDKSLYFLFKICRYYGFGHIFKDWLDILWSLFGWKIVSISAIYIFLRLWFPIRDALSKGDFARLTKMTKCSKKWIHEQYSTPIFTKEVHQEIVKHCKQWSQFWIFAARVNETIFALKKHFFCSFSE